MQIIGIVLIMLNAVLLLTFVVLTIIFTTKAVILERTKKQKKNSVNAPMHK